MRRRPVIRVREEPQFGWDSGGKCFRQFQTVARYLSVWVEETNLCIFVVFARIEPQSVQRVCHRVPSRDRFSFFGGKFKPFGINFVAAEIAMEGVVS
jgi:hypothetical protein